MIQGSVVTLTILRKGKTGHVRVKTANIQGHAVLGVLVAESYTFPFKINFKVGDIGGPSAGMMFALGIVDKLTPRNLTGDDLPDPRGQLLGHHRGGAGRAAPGQGGHAAPGHQRPDRDQGRP